MLGTFGGAVALLVPGMALAGNVGYLPTCNYTGTGPGNPSAQIIAAGHTPVAIAAANAGTLSGLTALIVTNCNSSNLSGVINADVTQAVANGMSLIVDDWNPSAATAASLPGTPAVVLALATGEDVDVAAGSPIATGPGGTLTNTSLDGGSSSHHGYTTTALPSGFVKLLTTANPGQTVAFGYAYGGGYVAYNGMPLDAYLPEGGKEFYGNCTPTDACAGMRTYLTNLLAWTKPSGPATTCASEGYTGTKLTWCKNICENGLTGATLDIWIHRWINRYRDLPYCAVEGGGEQPVPTLK
jgi:hypothetical protein